MQFLSHLRKLTSAVQSINKVVSFLLKHSVPPSTAPRGSLAHSRSLSHAGGSSSSAATATATATHAEADLWECILEELEKANLNARINIFYMLDSLLDQSLALGVESYRELVRKDLEKVVDLTVPRDAREGVLNRMSAMQVSRSLIGNCRGRPRGAPLAALPCRLEGGPSMSVDDRADANEPCIDMLQVLQSWKTRRLLPVSLLESLLDTLRDAQFPASSSSSSSTSTSSGFSRNDILRRMEDDRERHKRLRERIWVLPLPSLQDISSNPKLSTMLGTAVPTTASNSPASPASSASAPIATEQPKLVSLASYARDQRIHASPNGAGPQDGNAAGAVDGDAPGLDEESALDVEFEQAWDNVDAEAYADGLLPESDLQAMEAENTKCFG